jgi:pyruvate formate lyase activating enzyme
MRIGGLQKFSLIDYPGKVACVIFTQGCNFRCGYCHNPELVVPQQFCPTIPQENVLEFLKKRRNHLQGVVVSGGEATLQGDLIDFVVQVKSLGYLVKLDTNGSQPDKLRKLVDLKLVDYIAMDVKARFDRYEEAVGVPVDREKIKESIELIIGSGISHEFRTTVVKSLCLSADLVEIGRMIRGSEHYRLQQFRREQSVLDPSLIMQEHFSDDEFKDLQRNFQTA